MQTKGLARLAFSEAEAETPYPLLCGRGDLNSQSLSRTATSRLRVYQIPPRPLKTPVSSDVWAVYFIPLLIFSYDPLKSLILPFSLW